NVAMLLDMAASAFGDRVVLGAGTRTLTPDRLVELAAAGGARLREAGRPAVVYASTYGPAFACAVFSAANAGVPVVPLNYRLGVEQLGGLVANHAGALVLGDDAALAGGGNDVEAPEAWLAELDAAARAGATTEPPHDPELPAVLLYTSGTTSAAKAVILRHRHLTSYVLS